MADLLKLQHDCKHDPPSYHDDFLQVSLRFSALLELCQEDPSGDQSEFIRTLEFMTQVARVYPSDSTYLPDAIAGLLRACAPALRSDTRTGLVRSLMGLQNCGVAEPAAVVSLMFELLGVTDRALRQLMRSYIISTVRNLARPTGTRHSSTRTAGTLSKGAAMKQNQAIQAVVRRVLREGDAETARRALEINIELYARGLWKNEMVVLSIAHAINHSDARIVGAAIKFFVEEDRLAAQGRSLMSAGVVVMADGLADGLSVNNRDQLKAHIKELHESILTSKRKGVVMGRTQAKDQRKADRARDKIAKLQEVSQSLDALAATGASSAIEMLQNPEDIATRLVSRVRSNMLNGRRMPWELALLHIELAARLIGRYSLPMPEFYEHLSPLLRPGQANSTALLTAAATSVHPDADVYESMVLPIATNFCHPTLRPPVITVGLSAVRQMLLRQPELFDAPGDPNEANRRQVLLAELVGLRANASADKCVVAAAHGLRAAARRLCPQCLPADQRGKAADLALRTGVAGVVQGQGALAPDRVFGAQLLEEADSEDDAVDVDDEEGSAYDLSGSEFDGLDIDQMLDMADEADEDDDPVSREKRRRREAEKMRRLRRQAKHSVQAAQQLARMEAAKAWEVGSDSSDDSGDESDSDDEADTGVAAPAAPATVPIEQMRLLDDEDFAKIDKLEARARAKYTEKTGQAADAVAGRAVGNVAVQRSVGADELLAFMKHSKGSKEERRAACKAEAYENRRYGKKYASGASATNAEKRKTKDAGMVRHSRHVQVKVNRSARDKLHSKILHVRRQKEGIKGKKTPK